MLFKIRVEARMIYRLLRVRLYARVPLYMIKRTVTDIL